LPAALGCYLPCRGNELQEWEGSRGAGGKGGEQPVLPGERGLLGQGVRAAPLEKMQLPERMV